MTLHFDALSVEGTDGGSLGWQIGVQALGTALGARENDRTDTAVRRRFRDGTIVDGCKNIATFQPTCASLTRQQIVIATLEEVDSLGTTNFKDESDEDLYQVQPTY